MVPSCNSHSPSSPWSYLAKSNILLLRKRLYILFFWVDPEYQLWGWILHTMAHLREVQMLIEGSGPLWGAWRMVSLQLSEFNLILFSLCYALTLKLFWGSVPRIHRVEGMQGPDTQYGDTWCIYWREPGLEQTVQAELSPVNVAFHEL